MVIEYPSAEEIHELHSRIVAGGAKTEPGIRKPEAVESALAYISEGYFDQTPEDDPREGSTPHATNRG